MGKLYYLMGKSATGKDHIYRALQEELSLRPLVISTTRPMRAGEADGREYHFTGEDRMRALEKAGKIIEQRCYHTVQGDWYYYTADDGSLRLDEADYIGIGTLESYRKLTAYLGPEKIRPVYIETDDGTRLERALKREKKQARPDYAEVCRRFLTDTEDFSDGNLKAAGVRRRFSNNGALEDCIEEIRRAVKEDAF